MSEITSASSSSSSSPSSPEITYDLTSDTLYNQYKEYVESIKELSAPKPIKSGLFARKITNQLDIDIAKKMNTYYQLQKELFKHSEKPEHYTKIITPLKTFAEFDISTVYDSLSESEQPNTKSRILALLIQPNTDNITISKPTITHAFYKAFLPLTDIGAYTKVNKTKKEPEHSALIKNLIVLLTHIKNEYLIHKLTAYQRITDINKQSERTITYIYLIASIYPLLSLCLLSSGRFTILRIKNVDRCDDRLIKVSNRQFIDFLKILLTESQGGKKKPRKPRQPRTPKKR